MRWGYCSPVTHLLTTSTKSTWKLSVQQQTRLVLERPANVRSPHFCPIPKLLLQSLVYSRFVVLLFQLQTIAKTNRQWGICFAFKKYFKKYILFVFNYVFLISKINAVPITIIGQLSAQWSFYQLTGRVSWFNVLSHICNDCPGLTEGIDPIF